jgi:hypothetical protein
MVAAQQWRKTAKAAKNAEKNRGNGGESSSGWRMAALKAALAGSSGGESGSVSMKSDINEEKWDNESNGIESENNSSETA